MSAWRRHGSELAELFADVVGFGGPSIRPFKAGRHAAQAARRQRLDGARLACRTDLATGIRSDLSLVSREISSDPGTDDLRRPREARLGLIRRKILWCHAPLGGISKRGEMLP